MQLAPVPLGAALALLLALPPLAAQAQSNGSEDASTNPYTICAFYPQAAACPAVYQRALKDNDDPAARSVRDAFQFYGRYLKPPAAGLTHQDKAYLASAGIDLPADLDAGDLGGLHNVINDPELASDALARNQAVNGFINRALEAELYCGLNRCDAPSGA